VYVGEGCWGAPLRENNDDKSWTRASGSFNQFNWIFVDQDKIEVRTVMTDGSEQVGEVSASNIFEPPIGLSLWSPPGGDVIRLDKKRSASPSLSESPPRKDRPAPSTQPAPTQPKPATASAPETDDLGGDWDLLPRITPNPATGRVKIDYELAQPTDVSVVLVNTAREEIARLTYDNQTAGPYSRSLDFARLPAGKYLLVVRAGRKPIKRYQLVKG
jgi:acid phosphatase type 7